MPQLLDDDHGRHCPLCGAEPRAHGEHYPGEAEILSHWAEEIERLCERLRLLREGG